MIKPIYIFFIDAKVQDTLGLETYGMYFGIFNFAYILHIITDIGIQNYNSKTIAQQNNLLPEYLPNILGVKLVLSVVYLVVGTLLALLAGYDFKMIKFFIFIAINLILLSNILYLRTNISAMGKYRWDSIISIIDKVILIIVLGFFLFTSIVNDLSLYHYIFAQTFSFFIVFLIALFINFKLAKLVSIKFSYSFAKDLLRKSFPFSLIFLLMTLYMKMDGFMLERLLDTPTEAGIYAAAFRLYEAFNNIGYLFAVLLLPMFASQIQKLDKLRNLIHTSHNIMIFIAISAVIITIMYRFEIIEFLYPETHTEYHSEVLSILMLSFFAISLSYIYGTLLTAAGKMKLFNKIVFIGVIINLVLNLVLIPQKGAFGAAIATVVTQYFVLFGQYISSLKYFKVGFDRLLFYRRVVFIVLLLSCSYLIKNNIDFNWFYLLTISGIISIILAITTGLIKFSDLKQE